MTQKRNLSILEFSRLTGINRDNLRFYDKVGLLIPDTRNENKYRSYSRKQLSSAYLITMLRNLGVGLEEIKKYSEERNPKKMIELFEVQEMRILREINRLKETREIMHVYAEMVEESMIKETYVCRVEDKKKENVFLCEKISGEVDDDEAEIQSFEYAFKSGINLNCPLGSILDQEHYKKTNQFQITNYYFKTNRGKNTTKPEGKYAVLIGKLDPWKTTEGIEHLFAYIKKNKLSIVGEVYIEFLLDHLATQYIEEYTIKIEVRVERSFR